MAQGGQGRTAGGQVTRWRVTPRILPRLAGQVWVVIDAVERCPLELPRFPGRIGQLAAGECPVVVCPALEVPHTHARAEPNPALTLTRWTPCV